MANTTVNVKLLQAFDTETNWSTNNPVLLAGQMAISSDKNGMYKVGDGTSTWSALSYNAANTATTATSADTATKLTTARTIRTNLASTSTASFNGTANVTPGVTGTLPIGNGGTGTTTGHIAITAGTNTTSTASPAHGGTFTAIDSITKDDYGHVTAVNTKTVTLPSDNNTDTKVTNTLATTTKAYVTGTTSSATNTGTQVFATGVYLGATAGTLYASTFTGSLDGNATSADTATKLGSSTVGDSAKPIYLSSGTPTACSSTVGSADTPVYMSNGTITSSGVSLPTTYKKWSYATVGQNGSTTTNPYYKFASISTSKQNSDPWITFKVCTGFGDSMTQVGILSAHFRTESSGYWSSGELVWEYAGSGIDTSKFILAHNESESPTVVELWVNADYAYRLFHFYVIAEGNRNSDTNATAWTLYTTSSSGSESEITSGYTQIESALGTLSNPISGAATTATKLASANTIDGVAFDGSTSVTHYATCDTAAATAAKVATCDSDFSLVTGARVAVTFNYANSTNMPTLNVNSTGAKYIYSLYSSTGSTIDVASVLPGRWSAGSLIEFVYNGDGWIMVDGTTATTARYGVTKLDSSTNSPSTTLAAAPSAVMAAYDLASSANSAASEASSAAATAQEAAEAAQSTADEALNTVWADPEIYGDTFVSLGRAEDTTVGANSFAFGDKCEASGDYSQAFGYNTVASGNRSHAEGTSTTASAIGAHAEGTSTTASAIGAHAEGGNTVAGYNYSHAEGQYTKASAMYAHAEGGGAGVVSGTVTITYLEASGTYSHAEGYLTTASGNYGSHAEGRNTSASAIGAHAEGYYTTATSYYSHAGGRYNAAMTANTSTSSTTGDVFVLGKGISSSALANAFRVTYAGAVYGLSAFNSSGADYAEFIKPWYDDNPDGEDRVGYFVTVKDGLLYKAEEGDYIAGITSGNPSIVGNSDEDYYGMYERDEFNRIVWEDAPVETEQLDEDGNVVLDENGEPIMVETGEVIPNGRQKISDTWDNTLQDSYVERKDRPEWDYVGMVGVLPVRDDGTCEVGSYCKCGEGGIATLAEERGFDTYMVIERKADNVVAVILK